MIKDTEELLDGRGPGQGIWKGVPSFHNLSGCITLPAPPCVHQPESSLNPTVLGFFWRLHHIGMINYQLNFHPLSPLWRMGERWDCKF